MFWNNKRKEEVEERKRRSRTLENVLTVALPASAALASVTYATLQNMNKKRKGSNVLSGDIMEKRFSELNPIGQRIVNETIGLENMTASKFKTVRKIQNIAEDIKTLMPIIQNLPPEQQQQVVRSITRIGIKNAVNQVPARYKDRVIGIIFDGNSDWYNVAAAEIQSTELI